MGIIDNYLFARDEFGGSSVSLNSHYSYEDVGSTNSLPRNKESSLDQVFWLELETTLLLKASRYLGSLKTDKLV